MKDRRDKLEEYASLIQSIADDLIVYRDFYGGDVDPFKMAHKESPQKFEKLEKICQELEIIMPFRNQYGS